MIGGKRVLAIVPARGGSKGLPGKNVKLLGGKPLIAWSIDAAKASKTIDRAIVSTDDEAIATAARAAGGDLPFMRPAQFATDEATMDVVVLHALDELEKRGETYDLGVVLQPTSPLREPHDIDDALAHMRKLDAKSLASVTEPGKSPYWMHGIGEDGRLTSLFPHLAEAPRRRQSLPKAYALNGAVFAFDVPWFREKKKFVCDETVAFVMPEERSMDVDRAIDFDLCELHLSRR